MMEKDNAIAQQKFNIYFASLISEPTESLVVAFTKNRELAEETLKQLDAEARELLKMPPKKKEEAK